MWASLVQGYWKLYVVFITIVVIIGTEITVSYQTVQANLAADEGVVSTQHEILLADGALVGLVDMETGYRGFLITGQEPFLEPYVSGRAQYQADLQQLLQLRDQSPAQLARWRSIAELAQAWQDDITQPTIAHRRSLAVDETNLDGLVAMVASGEGKQRLDRMRAMFAEAIISDQQALGQRRQEQLAADSRLLGVLVWGTLGAAVFAIVLGGGIFRYIQRERLAGVRLAVRTTEHELYNELSVASGNVQLLQRRLTTAEHQVWANRARDSIVRATEIIRGMRNLPELRENVWTEGMHVTLDLRRRATRVG